MSCCTALQSPTTPAVIPSYIIVLPTSQRMALCSVQRGVVVTGCLPLLPAERDVGLQTNFCCLQSQAQRYALPSRKSLLCSLLPSPLLPEAPYPLCSGASFNRPKKGQNRESGGPRDNRNQCRGTSRPRGGRLWLREEFHPGRHGPRSVYGGSNSSWVGSRTGISSQHGRAKSSCGGMRGTGCLWWGGSSSSCGAATAVRRT
jgi:hypothetical protein